jgi:MraZ protein
MWNKVEESGMWYGEYAHTLDDKSRFILPAKFREKIKQLSDRRFYLTRGLERCLFFYHQEAWMRLEARLKTLSFTDRDSRFFNRFIFSGVQEIELDGQGRVVIPDYLKSFAAIKKDVIIVGVSERIEIWDKTSWNSFFAENSKKFEDISERLFRNEAESGANPK